MKIPFLISLLLVTAFSAFTQTIINNELTENYQLINGTKVSLLLEEGFTQAVNFQGLQQTESNASIMAFSVPAPFAEIEKGMTADNLKKKGIEVIAIDQLQINGKSALLMTGKQFARDNYFRKYILVLDADKETVLLNGSIPEELTSICSSVRKMMLSVIYNENQSTDPLANAGFSLDTTGTAFRFAKGSFNGLVYTFDGKMPTESKEKTNLMASKSHSEVVIEDKKLYCINRLKQAPFEIDSIQEIQPLTIDGISGYSILADGKSKTTKQQQLVYQVILFSDQMYYIFMGTTTDETGKSLEQIKALLATFKRN